MYDPCPGHHSLRDVFFFPLRLAFLGGGNFTCACVFRQFNHLTFEGDEGRGWVIFKLQKCPANRPGTKNTYIAWSQYSCYLNPKIREKIDLITKEDSKNVLSHAWLPTTPSKVKGSALEENGTLLEFYD